MKRLYGPRHRNSKRLFVHTVLRQRESTLEDQAHAYLDTLLGQGVPMAEAMADIDDWKRRMERRDLFGYSRRRPDVQTEQPQVSPPQQTPASKPKHKPNPELLARNAEMFQLSQQGWSQRKLGLRYGIDKSRVSRILKQMRRQTEPATTNVVEFPGND